MYLGGHHILALPGIFGTQCLPWCQFLNHGFLNVTVTLPFSKGDRCTLA